MEWLTLAAIIATISSGTICVMQTRFSRRDIPVAAMLTAVFAARLFIATPAFAHANFHGSLLLNHAWFSPLESTRNYGATGSIIQGAWLALAGADLQALAVFNQLISVLFLLPIALLARRLSGSNTPALLVIAMGAFHPVLVWLGASEDAQCIGLLLGWSAIAAMDRYLENGRTADLLFSVCAAISVLFTKQLLMLFAPLIFALPLWRNSWRALIDAKFIIGGVVVAAVIIVRISQTAASPMDAMHALRMMDSLANPAVLKMALLTHPLLPGTSFLVTPFAVIGAIHLLRRSRTGWFHVLTALFFFALSLWLVEGEKVRLMFRVPVISAALLLAGIGAWNTGQWLMALFRIQWLKIPWRETAALWIAVLMFAACPRFLPGWRLLSTRDAQTLEYRFIRSARSELPREMYIVIDNRHIDTDYTFPLHLLDGAGIRLHPLPPGSHAQTQLNRDIPIVLLKGVFCYARKAIDLVGMSRQELFTAMQQGDFNTTMKLMDDNLAVPATLRPDCERLLENATPIGPSATLNDVAQEAPFALYPRIPMHMQFYRINRDTWLKQGGNAEP